MVVAGAGPENAAYVAVPFLHQYTRHFTNPKVMLSGRGTNTNNARTRHTVLADAMFENDCDGTGVTQAFKTT